MSGEVPGPEDPNNETEEKMSDADREAWLLDAAQTRQRTMKERDPKLDTLLEERYPDPDELEEERRKPSPDEDYKNKGA